MLLVLNDLQKIHTISIFKCCDHLKKVLLMSHNIMYFVRPKLNEREGTCPGDSGKNVEIISKLPKKYFLINPWIRQTKNFAHLLLYLGALVY